MKEFGDLRSSPPPGGVGYQEVLATKKSGQEEIEWLACGSHHRQMVDERIRRLAQPSTAWRRWLPRGVGYQEE